MRVLPLVQHVFPPPRFIQLPSYGIDISDTSLKYFQFEKPHPNDPNLLIKDWGNIDVKPGIVDRGTVLDEDGLTAVLKEFKTKSKAEYVRMSLPEEHAYLFETTIDRGVAYKEIRGLLESTLEENVPLSARDAFFDYEIIDDEEDENMLRVAVAVYARDTITKYYGACASANLVPISFEIEAQAVARSVIPHSMCETNMVVDFGKTRTGIGIVYNGMLMYTSTIEVGGQDLSTAMREVLGDIDEKKLTKIKNTEGLKQAKNNAELFAALKGPMETIVGEVATRIEYWHTRDIDRSERKIKQVVLCGGSSNLFGIDTYLASRLSVPVEQGVVWTNAFSLETYIPPITKRYSYGYATAVGLALTDFINYDHD